MDVTYFIHLQANYVQILLSEPNQWVSEKSRLVREGEDFCRLYGTSCSLWSVQNHCFHSSSERCGGGTEHRHPHQSRKTSVLHLPLIFVNAKCILSRGLKISYYSASKDLKLFFFSEGVSDIKSYILFLCCKSNNLEEKFCHVVERAAQTMMTMDQSDSSFS